MFTNPKSLWAEKLFPFMFSLGNWLSLHSSRMYFSHEDPHKGVLMPCAFQWQSFYLRGHQERRGGTEAPRVLVLTLTVIRESASFEGLADLHRYSKCWFCAQSISQPLFTCSFLYLWSKRLLRMASQGIIGVGSWCYIQGMYRGPHADLLSENTAQERC